MLRVMNGETRALIARPTELPADNGGSMFVGSNSTVFLRAMVLVPDAAPKTWPSRTCTYKGRRAPGLSFIFSATNQQDK